MVSPLWEIARTKRDGSLGGSVMASTRRCEQIWNRDPECGGEHLKCAQGHVSLTTLHRADICPMKPANGGELFLRDPLGMTEGSDVGRQDAGKMLPWFTELLLCHGTKPFGMSEDQLTLDPWHL